MALNLGNSDTEIVDIIFNTKVDSAGLDQLEASYEQINKLLNSAKRSTKITNATLLKNASEQAKEELKAIKKLTEAYKEYRKALQTPFVNKQKGLRNAFIGALGDYQKVTKGSKTAADNLVRIMRSADKQIALDKEKFLKQEEAAQRKADKFYYDAARKRKMFDMAAHNQRLMAFKAEADAKKKYLGFGTTAKEAKQASEYIKQELRARQNASKKFFDLQRKQFQFDLKAHNARMHYIKAEADAHTAATRRMAWGYTPQGAKQTMAAQKRLNPSHPEYVDNEFQKIHGTDLRTFGHKIVTTAQYATAGLMYIQLLKTIRGAADAVLDFNKYSAQMAAVFRIDGREADNLTRKLEDLGSTLGGEQKEIYNIALSLGRAGVATKDLTKASEVVIKMAYLTGDSFTEATNAIITYSEVFGKGTGRGIGYSIQELGDKLAYVANVSRLSTQDIGIFSNYALGAAHSAGLTVDAVGAMAAAFSNAGMNASTIGTQIRRFTTLLSDQTTNIVRFFQNVGVSQSFLRKELLASLDGTQEGINRSNTALKNFAAKLASLSDNEFAQFTSGMDLLARNSLTFLRQEAGAFTTYLEGSIHKANGLLAESDKILQAYSVDWQKMMNSFKAAAADLGNSAIVKNVMTALDILFSRIQTANSEVTKLAEQYGTAEDRKFLERYEKQQEAVKTLANLANTSQGQTRINALITLRHQSRILKLEQKRYELIAKRLNKQQNAATLHLLEQQQLKTQIAYMEASKNNEAEKAAYLHEILSSLTAEIDARKEIKAEEEASAKRNAEALALQKKYQEATKELTEKLAASKYLDSAKLESWATMVSQLSKSLPSALSVFTNMLDIAHQKQQRLVWATKELVANTSATMGNEYAKGTPKYAELQQLVTYVQQMKNVETASRAVFELSQKKLNLEKRLSTLRAHGAKDSDKQVIALTQMISLYQSVLSIMNQGQEIQSQIQKAQNSVWRGTDKQIATYSQQIKSLEARIKANQAKLARQTEKDRVHQTNLQILDSMKKEKENLIVQRKEVEKQVGAHAKDSKILREIDERLAIILAKQKILTKDDKEYLKSIRDLNRQKAEDETIAAMIRANTQLSNMVKIMQGRNDEQDHYVSLLVLANKLQKEGYNDLSKQVKEKHDELLGASQAAKLMTKWRNRNPLVKMDSKYNTLAGGYKYLVERNKADYEADYKSYDEYIARKHELDIMYQEELKVLNDETINTYKKMLDVQNVYAKQVTDSLKTNFGDFFDFSSDGFLKLDKLATEVLHDIYMQIVKQSLINPMSKYFGNMLGGWINNAMPGSGGTTPTDLGYQPGLLNQLGSAHGNVFTHLQAYANGGVVTRPTVFPMANGGVGLMGEAGAEAIMPLTRINGDLGVKSVAGAVVINVENKTGLPIDIEKIGEATQDDGTRIIQVVMEHAQTNPEFRHVMGINS